MKTNTMDLIKVQYKYDGELVDAWTYKIPIH